MKYKIILLLLVFLFFLSAVLITYATLGDVNINVSFRNITLIKNGSTVSIDSEPFIYNGKVYLALRDIANLFNVPVNWNSDNHSVTLGTAEKSFWTLSELTFEEMSFSKGSDESIVHSGSLYNKSVSGFGFSTIKDVVYKDALLFGGSEVEYFDFDLNKEFSHLTAFLGVTDDCIADPNDFGIINIYGDGNLIYSSPKLHANSEGFIVSILTEGISKLRIEKMTSGKSILKIGVAESKLYVKK